MCDGTDTAGPKVTTEQARSIGDRFLIILPQSPEKCDNLCKISH